MSIAFICTGTELLKGCTVNTHAACLGKLLTAAGLPLAFEMSVGDSEADLCRALGAALKGADQLVISGGLGPTRDDITLDVVARFFGLELESDPQLVRKVEDFWRRIHTGHCPKTQYRQARVPRGGRSIPNPQGSAAGIEFEAVYAGVLRHVLLTPGPPREFEPMAEEHLLPKLLEFSREKRIFTRGFLAAGVGESTVSAAIEPVIGCDGFAIAYTAIPEGTRVYLAGTDPALLDAKLEEARRAVGSAALPAGETELVPYVSQQLCRRHLTLGCAESCTGGLLSKQLTDLAGSSAFFNGAVVAYRNEVKHSLLGVPQEILDGVGAVSRECAAAMAEGCLRALACDCALSLTGIAGPSGATPEKPVGLVYAGIAVPGRPVEVLELKLRGSRAAVRERAAAKALIRLRELLDA